MGWVPINGLMLPSLGNIQWASSSTYWVQQGQFSIAEALMQMNAANHAPKRIAVVRDAKGRVAGAEEVAT